MKPLRRLTPVLILLALGATGCESRPRELHVSGAQFLLVRAEPTLKSPVLGFLPPGTRVRVSTTAGRATIAEKTDVWYRLADMSGFVFGGFLSDTAETDRPPLQLFAYYGDHASGLTHQLKIGFGRVEQNIIHSIHFGGKREAHETRRGRYRVEDGRILLDFDGFYAPLQLTWIPAVRGYAAANHGSYPLFLQFRQNGQRLKNGYGLEQFYYRDDGACALRALNEQSQLHDEHEGEYSGYYSHACAH